VSHKAGEHARRDLNNGTIIFAGTAQLPAGAPSRDGSRVFTLEVAVNPDDMHIVDVASNSSPALGARFLRDLLVRKHIERALGDAIHHIGTSYFNVTKRAMIAALEDVERRYRGFCKDGGGPAEIKQTRLHR